MQTQPVDLTDATVAAAVADGWPVPAPRASYAPVGFGSHHWVIDDAGGHRWFASVDGFPPAGRPAGLADLEAALGLAERARSAGCGFVLAPVPTTDGSVLRMINDRYALALYRYLEGRAGNFSDSFDSVDAGHVVDLLCALHAVGLDELPVGDQPGGRVPPNRVDRLVVAGRAGLETRLARSPADVAPGAYGDRLLRLLEDHHREVRLGLQRHDELVRAAGPQDARLVLTHGEPHPGNLLWTAEGLVLIDWDTAMLAPPERDVWLVDVRTDGAASRTYAERSGRVLQPELLSRYELAWALGDIAEFLEVLEGAPEETADTQWQWRALEGTVQGLSDLGADPDQP